MSNPPGPKDRQMCFTCRREVPLKIDGSLRKHNCGADQITSGGVAFSLPWSRPPLAQNDRDHWRVKASKFATAKLQARMAIRAAKVPLIAGAVVKLHYRVPDNRLRDSDGPAPTLKVVLDALVAEGVLPGDDFRYVPESGVRIHPPAKGLPGAMWAELSEIRLREAVA